MSYKKLTNEQKQQIIANINANISLNNSKRYMDKWNQIWTRIDSNYCLRLNDGNVGLWDSGKGMIKIDGRTRAGRLIEKK